MIGEAKDAEEQVQVEGKAEGEEKRRGPIRVQDVQRFWKTAPAHGEPGGSPCELYFP